MTNYVEIRNWDNFQHYRDRNPPWIKNYTELLSDDDYLGLSGHRRAILHGLWLEYARSHCRLPLDTRILTRRLDLRVTMADIVSLNDAGFITIRASTLQATRSKSARPEAETEAETEKEQPSFLPSEAKDQERTEGEDIDFDTINYDHILKEIPL